MLNNLTLRVLSSIVLIPLVLYISLFAPKEIFWGFLLLLVFAFGYEFIKLTKLKTTSIIIALIFTFVLVFINTLDGKLRSNIFLILTILSIVFWLSNIFFVVKYPKIKINNTFYQSIVFLFIISSFSSLLLLREELYLLLLLFLIVWGADSFAYIFGKLFGKHKLAPKLSGGKTIEGVVGGALSSVVITAIWIHFFADKGNYYDNYWFFVLAIITALISVVGDLYQSIYKREAGVSDSGNIIPGHGGVWDRIDGLIAAAPVFLSGSLLIFIYDILIFI